MIIISLGNYRVVLVTREFLLFSQTLYGDVAQLARVLDWQSNPRLFQLTINQLTKQFKKV